MRSWRARRVLVDADQGARETGAVNETAAHAGADHPRATITTSRSPRTDVPPKATL